MGIYGKAWKEFIKQSLLPIIFWVAVMNVAWEALSLAAGVRDLDWFRMVMLGVYLIIAVVSYYLSNRRKTNPIKWIKKIFKS